VHSRSSPGGAVQAAPCQVELQEQGAVGEGGEEAHVAGAPAAAGQAQPVEPVVGRGVPRLAGQGEGEPVPGDERRDRMFSRTGLSRPPKAPRLLLLLLLHCPCSNTRPGWSRKVEVSSMLHSLVSRTSTWYTKGCAMQVCGEASGAATWSAW